MTEGTPKAIEIKGIVRNATVIGTQDGQAEDLINLRFMDGSWRASGNGRQIENMPTGTIYEQLYVHTNIYHHLLGVDNGTLYWFAEIDNDGVTFYPLDGTTDRSLWPEDKQDLPTERVALTTVTGSMWVTQTGHLLTIIDEGEEFEFLVYIDSNKSYKLVSVDANGKETKPTIFPFGVAHFRLSSSINIKKTSVDLNSSRYWNGHDSINEDNVKADIIPSDVLLLASSAREEIREKNKFNQPFLVCAAVRLYDGSFAYASNPILMNPGSFLNYERLRGNTRVIDTPYLHNDFYPSQGFNGYRYAGDPGSFNANYNSANTTPLPEGALMTVRNGGNSYRAKDGINAAYTEGTKFTAQALGWNLLMQIEDIAFIKANPEIFQSICIFVTREIETIDYSYSDFHETDLIIKKSSNSSGDRYESLFNIGVKLPLHSKKYLIEQIKKENFFLLREYKIEELDTFANMDYVTIDLNSEIYPGLLKNLVQNNTLPIEAFVRDSYLPKVVYNYNGKLHIANYRTTPWRGYAISNYYNPYGGGSGYAENQSCEPKISIMQNQSNYKLQDVAWFLWIYNLPIAYVKIISRNTDGSTRVSVRAFTIEDYVTDIDISYEDYMSVRDWFKVIGSFLNPLLSIGGLTGVISVEIYVMQVQLYEASDTSSNYVKIYNKTFTINHQDFQNIYSIYINPDLLDNTLGNPVWQGTVQDCFPSHDSWGEQERLYNDDIQNHHFKVLPEEAGMSEYFPNGLKVSKTDQPMFFPVENTYQVGSAEILALMSNTIAVGTGQTGDAPLYVFCKDGVYALYVDSSGQMAYPNARILARDVCNNPRSVTPIDAGVVFTTDRGLMMIAGEQVQEIGAPAEGDVVQFWNAGSVDYSKIATASMQQIAGLPSELCSTTDFLTYLQDKGTSGKAAIINYNHNMRELMVSNPNYPYSYVLDREGNWSRRDYSAAQYVNNYPTSYRVDANGHFFKVDDEGDANTSLEHRKEADNKIFYLSNVIKLDSIGFKQAYRFVVRGYFEVTCGTRNVLLGSFQKPRDLYDSNILYNLDSAIYDSLEVGDTVILMNKNGHGSTQTLNVESKITGPDRIVLSGDIQGNTGDYDIYKVGVVVDNAIACVVEGSYDGRKFKPLGYNRKSGKFRDIGCIVERTDVRFFRICLSGQVTGKTRIDYMEMSAGASMLNTKIR